MSATLLLNADGQPVSIIPLSTLTWKEAITDMYLDKITILEWYEDWIVHSPSFETRVPAVAILKHYEKKKHILRFSKRNVFLRDGYICQYCGDDVSKKTATLDHVLPLSHGGKSTYENSVCSCAPCNANKGNDKNIKPKKAPIKPTYYQLVEQRKKMPFTGVHSSWARYLGIKG